MRRSLYLAALIGSLLIAHCASNPSSSPPGAGTGAGTGSGSGAGSINPGSSSNSSGGLGPSSSAPISSSSGGSSSGSSSGASGSSSSGGHAGSSSSGASSSGSSSGTSSGSSGGSSGAAGSDAGSDAGGTGVLGPAPTADSASKLGPYMVQMYTSGVPSDQDYVTPTIYYPSGATPPYPGVVVIPGFTEVQAQLADWGNFLASHGFVVMMVDSASGGAANTSVQPPSRASGLAEAVTNLIAENTRMGSPLAGQIDTSRMAIMGHSMGGGGTLLAANMNSNPAVKAAIGLCPWNPGGTYPNDTVASLIFAGTADTLVPPSQAKPEYDSIPATTPKVYAEFNGGTHFVANTPLGTAATDPVVARVGLSWLEVHEVGDTRYQQFIMNDSTMSTFDSKP